MTPLIQLKQSSPVLLVAFLLTCFGLSASAQAVSPPPDGGYPGGNTAEGQAALLSRTTGGFNTAVGFLSLRSNATGSFNTAIGAGTLLGNTADKNTATGAGALLTNTTGTLNTANGTFALFSNTAASANTAVGTFALFNHTINDGNTAVGYQTLYNDTTGTDNVAIGPYALLNSNGGFNNIAVGYTAGNGISTASNVICIGSPGMDVSTTTWIGNVFGVTTQNGTTAPVIVSADGQLGTVASSERFKKDISPMERASEVILSLRPVTFHYRSDTKETPQFGLVAEEVAKVNPALVLPDKEGKPYTVRYDAVNAMLLNEFLKEHRKVEAQRKDFEVAIAQQQSEIAALTATVKDQALQIQKVSAQLEASKPAPQMVNNP
jgi:hypothetical protein